MATRAVWALAVLLVAAPAHADNVEQAKQHYRQGLKLYNLNEYQAALEEFKQAYLQTPDSAFLFNIGQCNRQLGQYDQALKSYRSFLRESPNLPQRTRDDVQRLANEMEAAVREQHLQAPPTGMQPPQTERPPEKPPETVQAPVPPPVAPPPPAAPPPPWFKSGLGWGLAGGGLVVALVGAGILGGAAAANSNSRTATTLSEQRSQHDRALGMQSGSIALMSIGGAAVVGGVIVFALAGRHASTASGPDKKEASR